MKDEPQKDSLKFAIYKEIEAYYFYMSLAERVASREISEIFEELANEELEHKARIELEIMKTGKTIDINLPLKDPDKEYILSDSEELLDMDLRDVMQLGMAKEQASFERYVDLAARETDESIREIFLTLAEEELKHKLRFEEEFEKLLTD